MKATQAHLKITVILADSMVNSAQEPSVKAPLKTKIDPTKEKKHTNKLKQKCIQVFIIKRTKVLAFPSHKFIKLTRAYELWVVLYQFCIDRGISQNFLVLPSYWLWSKLGFCWLHTEKDVFNVLPATSQATAMTRRTLAKNFLTICLPTVLSPCMQWTWNHQINES